MIGFVATLLPLAPAFAEWTRGARQGLRERCMNICQGGDVTKSLQCTNYCVCLVADLEKAYPDQELYLRLDARQDPAFVQRGRAISQACINR
jgi:hypothetical protein